MSKRKQTPQMRPPSPIDELLDPRSSQSAASNDSVAEKQKNRKTESKKSSALEKVVAAPTLPPAVAKSKCTYYIPTDLAERIDLAHAQSRIYTRSSRYKASKSEFIEAAVTYALNEFDKNGQQSDVVTALAELLIKKMD